MKIIRSVGIEGCNGNGNFWFHKCLEAAVPYDVISVSSAGKEDTENAVLKTPA
ncbi:MAG TPA: hypothetical protein H9717_00690 [Candidatus Eisenbergiella merdipullorum]|uniref:Uncharacterized protein n=1 Tax=Candidatus Eisenbergiella merdipullorum TaxID=2838553 RepID=A0A9D2KZX4_9FIRM|nr:hypothetical protein [Candidatus Eisenbergiella merdipullorum]